MLFFWLDLVVDSECNCFVSALKNVVLKPVRLHCFQPAQSDLLSRLTDLCNRGGEISHYVDTALRDMILNFIVAGRDTTAGTLTWFFYMMSSHPEIADKIFDELSTVVAVAGKHSEGIPRASGTCLVVNLPDVSLCGNRDFR